MARRLLTLDSLVDSLVEKLEPGDLVFSWEDKKIYEVGVTEGKKTARPIVSSDVTLADGTIVLTVADIWQAMQEKHGKVLFEDLVCDAGG